MARGCLLEETFRVYSSSNGVPRLHGINILGALTNRVTSIAARSKSVYQQRWYDDLLKTCERLERFLYIHDIWMEKGLFIQLRDQWNEPLFIKPEHHSYRWRTSSLQPRVDIGRMNVAAPLTLSNLLRVIQRKYEDHRLG